MIGALRTPAQQLVTVFGGSGFLGRFVVRRARQARLPDPRRDAPARPRQPSPAARASSGRSMPSRPTCATRPRSRTRSRKADHVSTSSASCRRAGRQSFRRAPGRGAAADRRGGGARRRASSTSRPSAPIARSDSPYARTKAEGEAGAPGGAAGRGGAAPLAPVRAGRRLLHPLRDPRPDAAGPAARRRRHPLPAGLCGRRRRGDRPGGRRRRAGRPGLRARRPGGAHAARARRIRARA